MDRSHSYNNFEGSNNNSSSLTMMNIANNDNSNIGDSSNMINNNTSSSSGALHLRKTRIMRQKQRQLLHRQQKQELLLEHSGSGDRLDNHLHCDDVDCAQTHSTQLRKRHTLRRQKSALDDDDLDDANYAADLEGRSDEEEEAAEDDGFDVDDIDMDMDEEEDIEARFQIRKRLNEIGIAGPARDSNASATTSSHSQVHHQTAAIFSASTSASTSSSTCTDSDPAAAGIRDTSTSIGNGGAEREELSCSPSTRRQHFGQLKRDNSLHSDSSRYSSVDSLLESRKPDPEAILINLGFGPVGADNILARIPKRFLKPSQVRGIDTSAFVKRLQLANSLADHSALGYRGLTGNPDVPPSSIVAKIMQRFEVNERKKSMGSIELHGIQ